MPLTTGQEIKGVEPHELGQWYETANGVVFRLFEEPKRLFEGRNKEGDPDPVRHGGDVELVTGRDTLLVWRMADTKLLPAWWNWLPRWLVAWLRPLPKASSPAHDVKIAVKP